MAARDVKARLAHPCPLPRRHGGQTKVHQQRPPATWRAPASRRHRQRPKVRSRRPPRTFGHRRRLTTVHRQQRLRSAKNSPPTANIRDARAPAIKNASPTPVTTEWSPSPKPAADYDGFIIGIDDGKGTGRPTPNRPRSAKQSNVGQNTDTTGGPSATRPLDDQAEVEKLKPKLTICRGC